MFQPYARWAELVFDRRWRFAWAAIAAVAVLFILLPFGATAPLLTTSAMAVAAATFVFAWGVMLMCAWFHPRTGYLRPRDLSRSALKIPYAIIRAYFVVFLTSWFAGALLIPVLVFTLGWRAWV
jgi:hypothetical protein